MSANFTDNFRPPPNSSISLDEIQCYDSTVGNYVLTTASFIYALLVFPLFVFVLYVGFRRWRQQHSVPSAAIMIHSDFFTYNMAVVELAALFGYIFYHCSSYADLPVLLSVSVFIMYFTWPGMILFPILSCVERYLAVVHPITYRGLKRVGGVRIRNISTGCIWLSCFVWVGLVLLLKMDYYYRRPIAAFILILSLFIMVFCSLSVVRVLIRPRPGKVGRNKMLADQSKQRAVRTILIIMAVLWLKFCGNVIVIGIRFSSLSYVKCVGEMFTFMFFLPCGVVLPLLYLHRAGKLPNCKMFSWKQPNVS